MNEHTCDQLPTDILIERYEHGEWQVTSYLDEPQGMPPDIIPDIKFCPFCGVKLPD